MFQKIHIIILPLLMTIFVLGGCSSGGGDSSTAPATTVTALSGVAQKGPFQTASLVTVYKVGDDYNITSKKVTTRVSDNSGHYSVDVPWSGLSKIVVSGRYNDEVTGKVSDVNVTLGSLVELKQGEIQANVNVLTDMASAKVLTLLKRSKESSYQEIQKSVNSDLQVAFDINISDADINTLDLTELNGENAVANAKLLRLSGAILKSENPQQTLLKLQNSFSENNSSSFIRNEDFQLIKLHEADLNVTKLANNIGITQVDVTLKNIVNTKAYTDINASVYFKSSISLATGITEDKNLSIVEDAMEGNVSATLIGGEYWDLIYEHKSCIVGQDSFVYRTIDGLGVVNISIQTPTLITIPDINLTVLNTNIIANKMIMSNNGVVLELLESSQHGDANLSLSSGKYLLNYKPNSGFVGMETLKYRVTQTVGGCPFTQIGKIYIRVSNKSFTYDDINITVSLKQSVQFATNLTQTDTITYPTPPQNGDINKTLVGNEFWYLTYNENVCSATSDEFVYESPSGFGRVNVSIVKIPLNAPDYNYTVKNTRVLSNIPLPGDSSNLVISKNPLHGALSLTAVGGEGYVFTYDPVNSYEGSDSFEYTLTQNISDCSFKKVAKVSIDVTGITPLVTAVTKANVVGFLSANFPQDKATFGNSVAMNADTLIVGESSREYAHSKYNVGVVHIYKRTANEPELIQTLKANYPQEYSQTSYFGTTLAFHDGYLAISSISKSATTTINRVSLYKQNADKSFSFVKNFRQDETRTAGDFAKYGLGVNKNILVVGEGHRWDSTTGMNAGLIKVYRKSADAWLNTPTEITLDDNTTHNTLFGGQVVLMDNLIVVSSPYYTTDVNGTATMTGEIFVYKDNNTSIDLVQTLAVPKELQIYYGQFGYKLSTDGDYLAIGSEQASANGINAAGRVYVYAKDGDTLVKIASVIDKNPIADGHFGKTVAISGKYLAVSSDTTATSGYTDSRSYTHLYQYSGDSNYSRIALFDAKKLAKPLLVNYQEDTGFGTAIDMSGISVVSAAPSGFAYTSLGTKATKAGRVYLMSCDTSVASLVDYKSRVKMPEGFVRLNGMFTQTTDASFALSGTDASLFNINKGYYGKYNALNKTLNYDLPQDSNNDNIYDFTINISDNNRVKNYPMSVEIYKNYIIHTSENTNEASYNINNLYPLDSNGSSTVTQASNFASKVLVDETKIYASSKDKLYLFDKKDWDSNHELLDLVAEHIDYPDSSSHPYAHANLNKFDIDGNLIAFDAYKENDKNDSNQTLYIYDSTNLSTPQEKIAFYESSQDGLYPHKDVDTKHIQKVILDNRHLFVQYNKHFVHDDTNNSKDVLINMTDIDIYAYTDANQSFDYNQTIEVPRYTTSDSSSMDNYISTKNGFLAFAYRKNDAGVKVVAIYKYDSTAQEYLAFQSIDMNTSTGVQAVLEDGNHLVVKKIRFDDYEYNEIYQLNATGTAFELIDTLSPLEAGVTHNIKDGVYGAVGLAKISGNMLIMQIDKRLEESDFHPANSTQSIGDSHYIALFRWDTTTQKYIFANSFTKVNGSDYFALDYEIFDNSVVTSGQGSMNMFEFIAK